MKRRHLQSIVQASLRVSPVVLIRGARQTGKTTMAQLVAMGESGSRYITLDDPDQLSDALRDPKGFVAAAGSMTIIDEIQRAPGLLPVIKMSVDQDRRPGRYLLTGSADVFSLPRVSESLAGRMIVHTLHPLSQGEIEEQPEDFITAAFQGGEAFESAPGLSLRDLWTRILAGGFPEVALSLSPGDRDAWFRSFVITILQRDVRDIANITGLHDMPKLLSLLATRSSNLMNVAELSSSLGIPHTTLRRYLALLEATFLLQPLEPWAASLGRRLTRTPKAYLLDPGLTAHLTGESVNRLLDDPRRSGPLLEAFVVSELRRQATWSRTPVRVHFYRDVRGHEVDIILEDPQGRLVAIEVKASTSPSARDSDGIRRLAEAVGDRLVHGCILHTGPEITRRSGNLSMVPVSALWNTRAG